MALISELITVLKVQDAQFTQGILKAQSTVQGFTKSASNSFGLIKAAVAGIGIYALARAFNETTDSVSALADASERLGASVESIQRLQFAAGQVGVSAESVNSAMAKLAVNLGKAAKEGGDAATPFTQLGLSVENLLAMSPEDRFASVANALAQIQDPALQSAAGVDAMGKSFMQIGAFIRSDIGGNIALFKSLGSELSTNQVNAVDKLGDRYSELTSQWEGFKGQLEASLAGELTDFIKWVQQSIQDMGGLDKIVEQISYRFKQFGIIIGSTIDVGIMSFKGWKLALDTVTYGWAKLQEVLLKVRYELAQFFMQSAMAKGLKNEYQAQVNYVSALKTEIIKANKAKQELIRPTGTNAPTVAKINPVVSGELLAQRKITDEYKAQVEQIKQAVKAQQDKINKLSEERQLLADLAEGRGGELSRFDELGKQAEKIKQELAKIKQSGPELSGPGPKMNLGATFDLSAIEAGLQKFEEQRQSVTPEQLIQSRIKELNQAVSLLNNPQQRFGAGGLERDSRVELKVLVTAQEGLEAKIAQSKANKRVILQTLNEELDTAAGGIQ